jgi:hypothetical protein
VREIGPIRNGWHLFHWYTINDNRRGRDIPDGPLWREGRFYLNGPWGFHLFTACWAILRGGGWREWFTLDLALSIGGEDSRVTLHLGVSRLISLFLGFGVPRAWLRGWVYDTREFGIRLGYIGDIAWMWIASDDRMRDMASYYKAQKARGEHVGKSYFPTTAELWPGWQIKVRWPPVLDWIFGRDTYDRRALRTEQVVIPLDGKDYPATWTLEEMSRSRPRWPWRYGVHYGSEIKLEGDRPMFAGKGESGYDCGDDCIVSMGSNEITSAGTVGQYVSRVLEYRSRYGRATGQLPPEPSGNDIVAEATA